MVLQTVKNIQEHKDRLAQNTKPMVLQFSASWCGPCQRIKPTVDKLSNEHTNIDFCYVDIDTNQELAQEYGVRSVPTFCIIKDSKIIDTIVGASEGSLRDAIKQLNS